MQDIIGQIDFDITELYYDDKLQKPANCCECVVHTENARNIINKLLKFPLFFDINKPIIIATETANNIKDEINTNYKELIMAYGGFKTINEDGTIKNNNKNNKS